MCLTWRSRGTRQKRRAPQLYVGRIKNMFVQIVKFKLQPDTSRESFLALTEEMISWLETKLGFVAYELYEGTEFWSDRIAWENQEFAQDGLKDFLTTSIAKNMIHFVQKDYSSFFGRAVVSAPNGSESPTRRSRKHN